MPTLINLSSLRDSLPFFLLLWLLSPPLFSLLKFFPNSQEVLKHFQVLLPTPLAVAGGGGVVGWWGGEDDGGTPPLASAVSQPI